MLYALTPILGDSESVELFKSSIYPCNALLGNPKEINLTYITNFTEIIFFLKFIQHQSNNAKAIYTTTTFTHAIRI